MSPALKQVNTDVAKLYYSLLESQFNFVATLPAALRAQWRLQNDKPSQTDQETNDEMKEWLA